MLGVVATLLFFIIGTVLFDPDTSFIAGLLFVAQPGIVNVFKGGSPDTSSLNIALSIAIFLSYVTAFKAWRDFDLDQPESYTRPFTFTILTIVLFFVFRTAWTGFFYVVPFIAAHIALYWFITLLKHDWRWSLAPPAAMLAGLAIVWNSPFVRRTLYRLNIVDQTDVYPTAWSTVSELGPAGLDAFIGLYGWALLLLTVVGGALLAWREWSTLTATSFVLVWASLIVTPFFSGRFFIFAIAPVCLIAAYGIRRAGSYLATMEAFIPHTYRRVIWTGLLTVLVIVTAIPQSASALHLTPHMNDNRLHVAETIKEETGHDTQVQTWWDNGYMYEYYTDRQALFDGGSFVPHRVYWFAKALLDTNASKSANMMRMLHCGGGSHLDRYGSRPDRAVETLYSVMGTSRESARERIGDDVDRTHCVKNETLVVSSSILPKLPALKQFATWDFLLQRPAEDTARFQHGTCVENVCDYGFSYDLEAGRASFRGGQPSTFIYVNNSFGNRTVVEQPGGIDLTALVVGNDLFLLEEGMEDTVLIRALFFNDLNTFDLLTYTKDRERVVAYDVAPKI
jgi:hypothetical protein